MFQRNQLKEVAATYNGLKGLSIKRWLKSITSRLILLHCSAAGYLVILLKTQGDGNSFLTKLADFRKSAELASVFKEAFSNFILNTSGSAKRINLKIIGGVTSSAEFVC